MKSMRLDQPIFENIQPSFGNSFTVRRFTEQDCSSLPYWHCHPEYEVVYISNGKGKRQIADHISYYEDGDLIFLGPNIPHLGFAQELYEEHVEVVVQLREDFLGKDFLQRPELADVRQLFERAKSGVTFHGHTRWEVGQILQRMIDLDSFWRLHEFLKALQIMAHSQESTSLNVSHLTAEVKPQDSLRMKTIFKFVEDNYNRPFMQEEVAEAVNMSTGAFCRFFKKLNHKVFSDFLNEYRVARACNLLSSDLQSIADVCFASGFNNLAHFNKQFKEITGQTPSQYRKSLRNFVLSPV